MIIKDVEDHVFGGFASEPWTPYNRWYYGTSE
jgi:hypothetical protein